MRYRWVMMPILILILAAAAACTSTPKIERKAVDSTIDLSGRWNDADSRMVSEAMIRDCLDRPWLENFKRTYRDQKPTVIVGQIKNRSHEHINVRTFVKDLERALINSGRVQFVASKEERRGLREERLDMARNATDETMKGPGQEIGADFMLIGEINTIRDEIDGKAVMYYQTNLELIDLGTNVKAWIGEKKIKKLIQKNKYKW